MLEKTFYNFIVQELPIYDNVFYTYKNNKETKDL